MTSEKISYVFSSDAENDLDDILEYIINDLHNSEAASSTIRTHFAIRSLCFARRGIQLLLQFRELSRAWFPGAYTVRFRLRLFFMRCKSFAPHTPALRLFIKLTRICGGYLFWASVSPGQINMFLYSDTYPDLCGKPHLVNTHGPIRVIPVQRPLRIVWILSIHPVC